MNIYHQLLHVDWRLKDNRKAIKTARTDADRKRLQKLIEKDVKIQTDLVQQIVKQRIEAKQ